MKEDNKNAEVRIDKWLWAVRIFKTRTLAAGACDRKKIIINDVAVKASRIVKFNDVIFYKQTGITRQYRVKGLLHNRVSAKIATDFVEEITPDEDIKKYEAIRDDAFFIRERGTGRPSKKERRELD
ncbi:MAG: hypothetical protein A2491_21855, partial [Bacteroidetes bacterium RIFOXYC12_FULL_35_7]